MSREKNIAAQERLGEIIMEGNLDAMGEVFAASVVDHDPAKDQGPGPEGFKHFFTGLRTALPDIHLEVDHLVADDEHVCIAYTISGTHRGDFGGVPATGRRISARGMQIARFSDGKIVERWGSSDELGIMQQLDAAPQAA